MNKHRFHTILTILTLAVMMLTSTGFTAIVGYCTMTDSSECCCEETHENASPASDGFSISAPDLSCYSRTVAGGINGIDATLHSPDQLAMPALEAIPFQSAVVRAPLPARFSSLVSTDDAAPPGVDIYIRVGSFLI